ncbi:DUF3833 family protein [Ferrovibrio sp.]|uniref:DUF3833 family protein n=1 Tax=Ferrovibrio sp. TaxID=1917215 RepID=UPI001B469199|nr:DUF3833 family protein [Ferrovibrio sp.]MBP7065527.1 DUF3833 family protein [Ferrovibrio sp.]
MRPLRLAALLLLIITPLVGCAGPTRPDPAGLAAYGALDLERYFLGRSKAWGLFEPRFGGNVRQFTVELLGRQDGADLVLEEDFRFSDGETQRRVWRIRRQGDQFTGQADDVLGQAKGVAQGNGFRWRYDITLKTDDGGIDVSFDDWLYRFDDEVVLNRAAVRKFGLEVGQVLIAFRKLP